MVFGDLGALEVEMLGESTRVSLVGGRGGRFCNGHGDAW